MDTVQLCRYRRATQGRILKYFVAQVHTFGKAFECVEVIYSNSFMILYFKATRSPCLLFEKPFVGVERICSSSFMVLYFKALRSHNWQGFCVSKRHFQLQFYEPGLTWSEDIKMKVRNFIYIQKKERKADKRQSKTKTRQLHILAKIGMEKKIYMT